MTHRDRARGSHPNRAWPAGPGRRPRGSCVLDPGEATDLRSSAAEPDGGEIEFGPLDSVYLAPGWHYRLENVSADAAFFVYNMTRSRE